MSVKEFPWSSASATLPVQSLRDSAAATPVGGPAWRRRFRTFSVTIVTAPANSGMTVVWEIRLFMRHCTEYAFISDRLAPAGANRGKRVWKQVCPR